MILAEISRQDKNEQFQPRGSVEYILMNFDFAGFICYRDIHLFCLKICTAIIYSAATISSAYQKYIEI